MAEQPQRPTHAQRLDDLLEKTSRTFALSIPLLPEPTRREVTLAYLLFRIADTFEDATLWSQEQQLEALADFEDLLERPDRERAEQRSRQWVADLPLEHRGYLELLEEVPFVLDRVAELDAGGRRLVVHHTIRTSRGMAGFVSRTDENGVLSLETLQDLRDYCYVVAGIVGEMLTELYLLGRVELAPLADYLRERARLFGEALQLVNILKDSKFDAGEGRLYLPESVPRKEIFALARSDLEAAQEYTLALQRAGAERGLVAFNALPVQLAWATLDRVEEQGSGAKITRPEVYRIAEQLEHDLDADRPVVYPPFAEQRAR